jgi:NADPH-dependent 2,4-dienoyl-CoA reductase/sulfur reductase-like enzyme
MRTFDCEILILGAGPAGLSAALAAARCGKSVMVLDDNPRPGGQIWRDGPQVSLPRGPVACARQWQNSRALRC